MRRANRLSFSVLWLGVLSLLIAMTVIGGVFAALSPGNREIEYRGVTKLVVPDAVADTNGKLANQRFVVNGMECTYTIQPDVYFGCRKKNGETVLFMVNDSSPMQARSSASR